MSFTAGSELDILAFVSVLFLSFPPASSYQNVHCVGERFTVLGKGSLCWGRVHCVGERFTVLRKGLMCWGKVHCVGERFNVLGKGSLCWGKV